MPPTTEEAQQEHRIPAWADFRRFMDLTFADALNYTQQVVEELDPGAKTLVGGTQRPTSFNGTDWWLFSQSIGILEPYFGLDEFRSFNPDLPIIQACGYQDAGPELEEKLWRRALQSQSGATVFWNYTLHDPDLQLNSQGVAMQHAFNLLRGQGIARLLLGAWRDDTRIAMLYSQPSLYAAWIQDGDSRSGRSRRARHHANSHQAWQQALHQLGFQFHYLSYEQLARQGVDRGRFDVLVLPDALALSGAEVRAVKAFVAAGGVVLADGDPGRSDEHCKARPEAALEASDRLRILDLPSEAMETMVAGMASAVKPILATSDLRPPASLAAQSAEIVRYRDGECDYVAFLDAPHEAHRVEFGRTAHIYDLRGRRHLGEASTIDVPAGGDAVTIYSLLPSKVDALELTLSQRCHPGDEVVLRVRAQSAVPFRHVFAVQVHGPDGALRHMYGANLDAPDGKGLGKFRLAWNDMHGEWRVVATDAATGVTAEARFVVVD